MPPGWTRCRKPPARATGEALQAIVDLDLDELITIRPPRGFGRDWRGPGWIRAVRATLAQVGPQAERPGAPLRLPLGGALRRAASLPVDYLDKPVTARAAWVAQIWVSPPDQIWMSLDNQRGATRVGVSTSFGMACKPRRRVAALPASTRLPRAACRTAETVA